MQIQNGTTKFSDIVREMKPGGSFSGVDGGKHLRLTVDQDMQKRGGRFDGDIQKSGNLHIHSSDKTSGLNFIARNTKHSEASNAIKIAIDTEYGQGRGEEVFKELGLGKKISLDDIGEINKLLHSN